MTKITNEELAQFKELAQQYQKDREQLRKQEPVSGTCPNCGYCPHCGRGQQVMPVYPMYPQPIWWYQPWYVPTWTVTSGGNNS